MIASFVAGKVSMNRRKYKKHTAHPQLGEPTASRGYRPQSGLIKTCIAGGAGTTIAIIHVEIEVTASPASEGNLSAVGHLRRRLPLCVALNAGPGQPSKALLPAAQRKKCRVVFSLVAVTQYIHSIHTERGRTDLLLHDRATAM